MVTAARSPTFARRNRTLLGTILRHLVDAEYNDESDLLSYVLFDGEFTTQLIEMGRRDARARHAELCRFFTQLSP